jgi:hypothetical protein
MDLVPIIFVGLLVNLAASVLYLALEKRLRDWSGGNARSLISFVLGLLFLAGLLLTVDKLLPQIHLRPFELPYPRSNAGFSFWMALVLTSLVHFGSLVPSVLFFRRQEYTPDSSRAVYVSGSLDAGRQVLWAVLVISIARAQLLGVSVALTAAYVLGSLSAICLALAQVIDLLVTRRRLARARTTGQLDWTGYEKIGTLSAVSLILCGTTLALLID